MASSVIASTPPASIPVDVKVIGAALTYARMIQGEQSPTLSLRVDYDDGIVAQHKSEPPLSTRETITRAGKIETLSHPQIEQ